MIRRPLSRALLAAPLLAASLGAQLPNQGPRDPLIPVTPATTPPGNDTTGYWQQRADYAIHAVLDEARGAVRATGTLTYTNHSPDTLRELWLQQHLNAFRPGSRWSAVDEKEGRTRFQKLAEPDYGYERFTRAPRIDGREVRAEYPLAPDSTVVRLALPRPLAPGARVVVELAWEARPSTTARRQGRRDRSFDFAQWYPRVAVYDRHGWKPNALVPAGEFHGEYGTFDVTLWVRDDQVIGATGVPVEGDPGWARVAANGAVPVLQRGAYGTAGAAGVSGAASGAIAGAARVTGRLPAGHRAVRFRAEDVHHFAWSASPGFVYEGGTYVRPARAPRPGVRTWDTVAVHVLYRGDAEAFCAGQPRVQPCLVAARDGWRNGAALRNGVSTLRWLEEVFGTYAYPQMTILRRLDGGGTEFPMMMQNGSNSAGLVTHEGGHIYAHGMLGNNEWQSGWMDEGLTSYQSDWQVGETRPQLAARLARAGDRDPSAPADSALAALRREKDGTARARATAFAAGRLEPIGTRADAFRDFATYNTAVYTRASEMYEALHDLVGDAAFRSFLRDYYGRWAHRHVDRWAMQGSAERASGRPLGWFFDQWVNTASVIAYALRDARVERVDGGWRTTVRLERTGAYRHAMPVGVRTPSGWVVARGDAQRDGEVLEFVTPERPDVVRLDPYGATEAVGVEVVLR